MNFLRYTIITTILMISTLNAMPARSGLLTFTQGDGTKFEGYLKGDSAFHWIESDSKVVMFNKKDNTYYNARVNTKGNLELTNKKPAAKRVYTSQNAALTSSPKSTHFLDKNTTDALKKMRTDAHKGNHPR